ncbi:MAG TPA: hypothetical protein VJC39_02480 [Candidatus Nanoarchaeia archaeon]|nr:hypothetical protein [Candidatus Nanoarchaeia archaeon]
MFPDTFESLQAVLPSELKFSASKAFLDRLSFVRKYASGNIWLVGGYLYRSIIQELYGIPIKEGIDLDFIVEGINLPLLEKRMGVFLVGSCNSVKVLSLGGKNYNLT